MAKIISFCNQKGGTGKTTSAINLASCLAIFQKRILLVDLDPQSNATSGLGIDKSKITKSTYHLLLESLPLNEIIQKTRIANLDLVPANIHLTGASVELVGVFTREFRLKKALDSTKEIYDFIFIDCPPSLGLLTINALTASHSVIIPVQCEYYALEGLSQLLDTIKLVKDNLNSNLEIEGILLTMADFRTNLCKEVIRETRNHFEEKVYNAIIPRNIKLSEAPSFGKSIFEYDKNSLGAKKYLEFTKEFLENTFKNVQSDFKNVQSEKNTMKLDKMEIKEEILEQPQGEV